jgi:hypothetical protein
MADQAKGGLGNYPPARCFLGGMPHTMAAARQESAANHPLMAWVA